MSDQAQRHAASSQPPGHVDANDLAFEELRHIIVSPEQEQIVEIRSRLESPERRIEDVSSVVAEAIQMRRDRGDSAALFTAFAPTIQETLRESVRKDPHVLADALFPVMGPAIRKSITETLRSMLESFNEALENSISLRGIQWRVEALRTGKAFAEIVLIHSLVFRVEQVFLIHRETGLVLNHVTAPDVATQDPSMVAGMLSAIQQFVRDSFAASHDSSLDSMTVGGLEVWLEEGPHAVLAAVIRGHAPQDYRLALEETLEAIEKDFAGVLESFQGDARPFRAADVRLQTLLVKHYREKPQSKRKPRLAIAAGALLLLLGAGWVSYVTYEVHKWSQFARALGAHPGIVVTSYAKSGGRWHIRGFRDPLAADPSDELSQYGLDAKDAALELVPFYSLDDSIVTQRATHLLAPPSAVKLEEHSGTLAASGSASSLWIATLRDRAPLVAGVKTVDTSQLGNTDISGLQSIVLTFPTGQAKLDPGQEDSLARVLDDLHALRKYADITNQKLLVSIIGHTDSTGIEGTNQVLSDQRAAAIASSLMRAGIPGDSLSARGVGTTQPLRAETNEEGRHLNRSVTFHIDLSPVVAAP